MVRVIFPLLKKRIVIFHFVYTMSIICKYRPVGTKLGQNIYVQWNLNEFDHGSNFDRNKWSYLLLNLEKLLHSTLFTL